MLVTLPGTETKRQNLVQPVNYLASLTNYGFRRYSFPIYVLCCGKHENPEKFFANKLPTNLFMKKVTGQIRQTMLATSAVTIQNLIRRLDTGHFVGRRPTTHTTLGLGPTRTEHCIENGYQGLANCGQL